MKSLRLGLAAAIYAISAVVCLATPYLLPPSAVEAFVLPNFLFVGIPLCVSGLLLAAVHGQHRLDESRDRATALVWAFGVFLMALPVPFWGAALGRYNLMLWIQATGTALSAAFLVALAGRIWTQRSRMRLFLSTGIAVLALLFGRVTYGIITGIFVEYTGGLEGSPRIPRHSWKRSPSPALRSRSEFWVTSSQQRGVARPWPANTPLQPTSGAGGSGWFDRSRAPLAAERRDVGQTGIRAWLGSGVRVE